MTSDPLLFSQALEGFYLARRADGYSPKTIDQYKWGLSKFFAHINDKPMQDVSLDDARKFIVCIQDNHPELNQVSVFHIWKAIRALYKWLEPELQIPNVMTGLKQPPFQPNEIIPLSNDDVEKLLKASAQIDHVEETKQYQAKTPNAARNRLIILFLLDTGLRVGEMTRLNVEDVNLETCEVTVKAFRSSRKSRPRTVYIGRRTQKELWRYLLNRNENKNDPLFLSTQDRRMTPDGVKHLISRIAKRAKVLNAHPHLLRHTFAIQYLRNGGDIFTLQKLLGHNSLEMVQHYLSLANTDMEAAHRRASPVDVWRL